MRRNTSRFTHLLTLLSFAAPAAAAPPKLPSVAPATVGMDASRLSAIDGIVEEGLRRGRMPGAVVMVGRRGKIVYFKAFGHRQLKPSKQPMTTDTVFDMASITKPVATATSVMHLVERGKLNPADQVVMYLPTFGQSGKDTVTLYHLLTHQSGLIPDNSLKDYLDGPKKSFERIHALSLRARPSKAFMYSDVGFLVLAELVEKVSGLTVHEYSQRHIFQPLGMTETGYLPSKPLRVRAAVTQQRDGKWLRGVVHDPRAAKLDGVAGHAGLFSTARDLAVYAQMMIDGGEYGGARVLKPETVQLMTKRYEVPRGYRGLGWDKQSPYSSNRGDLLSRSAFGHGGFTGTVLWIDPEQELFFIFLSNRVHPDGKGSVNTLAGRIATVAAASIVPRVERKSSSLPRTPARTPVKTGVDVLLESEFRELRGRKVGLICNHTGIDREGVSTVLRLHNSPHVELKALFSPEHGFAGTQDVKHIADSQENSTGLKIHSLYGKTRTPTPEMLAGLDTLVFDIQDIGTRFYTYISTMGNAMRAASKQGLRFVVLDRPNPINGVDVAGPVLDAGSESFVGFHTLPVRHGMTVGELAALFNAELKLNLDLRVIKMQGWRRSAYFDETGLWWVNPSPNMRSLTEAVLYPGVGLLETTNLSVGRGTDTPFEVIGAPWMNGRVLAQALNDQNLPGARFVPIRFTPTASKFRGEVCEGVNIIVTDRSRFQSVRTGLEIAHALLRLHKEEWNTDAFNRLLANKKTFESVRNGVRTDEIEIGFREELLKFERRRTQYLLYR